VDSLGPPIDVRALFPVERRHCLELLAELEPADWSAPTACPGWSVHDLVAHLVHDHLRRLSGGRDRYGTFEPVPDAELPPLVHRANQEFVEAARGLSPQVLSSMLASFGPQLDAYWAGCDLAALSKLSVSWAAPDAPAPLWLDIAREYTEFWVHQQQLRDAVRRPGGTDPELLTPVVDTFLRALPHTLREAPGNAVRVRVGGRSWDAVRGADGWSMRVAESPDVVVTLAPDTLWRLATRGISPAEARASARIEGDERLAGTVLQIVSIVL
jgi:uncharacterized protein (TIGR03083 family)